MKYKIGDKLKCTSKNDKSNIQYFEIVDILKSFKTDKTIYIDARNYYLNEEDPIFTYEKIDKFPWE